VSSVTEDYSEYESVDEEESEPEKPVKSKGKKKSEMKTDTTDTTAENMHKKVVAKGSVKKEQSSKALLGGKKIMKGQGSLSDFFSAPKLKK
jgi:DNA polymerase delta subunit 3